MTAPNIKVALVVVSDTASADPTQDRCREVVLNVLKEKWTAAELVETLYIPDELQKISSSLVRLCDESKVHLVLTSGGTGFAMRDVTPEATQSVIHRQATSITNMILEKSLQITPMAALSRAVCGIRHQSIILNLPGSPKGTRECLEIAIGILPHAIRLLNSPSQPHSTPHFTPSDFSTQPKAKVHSHDALKFCCDCGNHPSDEIETQKTESGPEANPSNVARRNRKSPFPMVSMEESLEIIHKQTQQLPIEEVPLDYQLVGRIVARDILSPINLPSFPTSVKDGYAVRSADGTGEFEVVGSATAGFSKSSQSSDGPLQTGSEDIPLLAEKKIMRVTTGAPVPSGADAVVMVEDTELVQSRELVVDGRHTEEEHIVRIMKKASSGQDIRPVGFDIQKEQILLRKGCVIGPAEVGILASVGIKSVPLFSIPKVALLSTGDELVDFQKEPGPFQIRDSNRPMLMACLHKSTATVKDFGIAKDKIQQLEATIDEALAWSDILITTGGVSMGELDLLKDILKKKGTIHFGRVSMKPGKPTTFATVSYPSSQRPKLVFSLPGNPVSAYVTFYLFVYPSIRKMTGFENTQLPTVGVKALSDIKLDPERPEYHRAVLHWSIKENCYVASSTGKQDSSRLLSAVGAEALLILPTKNPRDASHIIREGEYIQAHLLPSS